MLRIRNLLFTLACLTLAWLVAAAPTTRLGFAPGRGGAAEAEEESEGELGPRSPLGEWLIAQRAGESGTVRTVAFRRALDQAVDLSRATARTTPKLADAAWTHLGPTNIGGRVSEIAVDPTADDTVYAATASGGMWKSTDGALTWDYAWAPGITQAMGAVAVGSDGTIYAGTGEPNPGGGSITWGGTGLYRSRDDGATWQHIGLPTSGAIGRIAVDPKDPKRVFVASAGNLFVPGGERGLYRSLDGGDSWELLLAGENATTGAADVAIDPVNSNNILVGMWDHQRLPTHRVYAGPGSGVFRSTDGGATWQEATLPGNVAPNEVGRIGVAFAASDPTRAYAVVANKLNGTAVGLWRSNDGGATWSRTAASPGSLSQSSDGWWFGKIWVDPGDKERLFVAGLELVESTNGGGSFTAHSNTTAGVVTGANQVLVHADQHGMAWDPNAAGRVYLANDGGVYRSDANGRIGTWIGAAVQGWTQHYSVDVSEQNPNRVVSGLQDNMCQRNYVGGNVGHPHTWTKYGLCGDGLQTLINFEDDRLVYGCAQYGGNCSRTEDGGVAFRFLGGTTSDRRGWWAPMLFDPADADVMYFGGNIVNRSSDGGLSWSAISPDLTTDPPQLDPNTGYRIFGTITTIAVAPSDSKALYVGTDDGLLWRTTNTGQSWTQLQDGDADNDLPGTWVTRVAVDPANPDVAYASFSGFRGGDNAPHVVRTTDGGATWSDVSGDLPDAPVNEILALPGGRLVVGTDVGVFLSEDADTVQVTDTTSASWLAVGSGLPAVPILDLRHHKGTNTLTAATFGHGIQRVTLPA